MTQMHALSAVRHPQEFESELKNSADDAADEGKKIADDVKSKVDDTLK
jgi:hypothetical protein